MNDLQHEGINTELPVCRPAALDNGSNFVAVIERLASNPDVDPVKLEKFMDLQERILDRNAEQSFNAGMVACQSEIRVVRQNKRNNQTSSNYSDHTEILKQCKPIYTKHGFALSFYEGETSKDKHVRVMVDIMHSQGHTKTRFKDFPLDDVGIKGSVNKTQIHANQSAFTYGKRNLTCMIFNIPTGDDDDGNAASGAQYITIDQQTEISDLVQEIYDPKPEIFWNYMKVENASQILASDYAKAKTALMKAKERKAKS